MIKMNKRKNIFWMFFIFGIFIFISISLSFVSAYTDSYYSSQYNNAMGLGIFSGSGSLRIDESMCQQGTDFMIQINPLGCEPNPVRSDLLAEENVNVFCKMTAVQINPFIDVTQIDNIRFKEEYPKEVLGIGYMPAQSALGYQPDNLEGSLVLNNLGYVVITLKKQPVESALTNCKKGTLGLSEVCWVEGNLTAMLRYDVQNSFGVGDAVFYLPYVDEEDWKNDYVRYSFWKGRGYLRAVSVDEDKASITIYSDNSVASNLLKGGGRTYSLAKYTTVPLKTGETSGKIYLPGLSPCLASLQLTLEDVVDPDTKARLKVNDDYMELGKDENFLDSRCQVKEISKQGLSSEVKIKCKEDDDTGLFSIGGDTFSLRIFPRVDLKVNGETKSYEVGDFLYQVGDKFVYLGYVGVEGDTAVIDNDKLYVYLVALPEKEERLTDSELTSVANNAENMITSTGETATIKEISERSRNAMGWVIRIGKLTIKGEDFKFIPYKDPQTGFASTGYPFLDGVVSLEGLSNTDYMDTFDINSGEDYAEYYNSAMSDFDTVINSYTNEFEKVNSVQTYGELALMEEIKLADALGQKAKMLELCKKFAEDYPNSLESIEPCVDPLKLSNSEISVKDVLINDYLRRISFEGVNEPSVDDYSARILVKGPARSEYFDLRKNKPISLLGLRTEGETGDTIPEETEDKIFNSEYVSPTFLLKNRLEVEEFCYRYYEKTWHWSFGCKDKSDWIWVLDTEDEKGKSPSQKEVTFINSLQGKSYLEGLGLLMARTVEDKGSLSTFATEFFGNLDTTIMDKEEIFRVAATLAKHHYYKYDSDIGWQWSLDKDNWMKTNVYKVSGGRHNGDQPNNDNIELITLLDKTNSKKDTAFYKGVAYLFAMTSEEGLPKQAEEQQEEGTALVDNPEYVMLEGLEEGSASIEISVDNINTKGDHLTDTKAFTKNMPQSYGAYTFTLVDINLKKVAKVSVKANTDLARSNSSFNFKIGIEKRAIQLSPEKAADRISEINKSIQDWQKVSNYLNGVVKAMRFACIATDAVLTIKNIIANRDGTAIAREKVMTDEGGWNDKCREEMAIDPDAYTSFNACFLEHSDAIENDVDTMAAAIKRRDSILRSTTGSSDTSNPDFMTAYSKTTYDILKSSDKLTPEQLAEAEDILSSAETKGLIEKGAYRSDDLEEIQLYALYLMNSSRSTELDNEMLERLNSSISDVTTNAGRYLETATRATQLGININQIISVNVKENTKQVMYTGSTKKTYEKVLPSYISDNTPVQYVQTDVGDYDYLFVLDKNTGTDTYPILKMEGKLQIYNLTGDLVEENNVNYNFLQNFVFKKVDATSYENSYDSSYGSTFSGAILRYFETGTYKGYPAVVPFDTKNGWYAGIRYPETSYDASGKVESFYLCNVMEDGTEEFQLENFGGDMCQLIDLKDAATYTFPYINDAQKVNTLITQARNAIEIAQRERARKEGLTSVYINGKPVKVGEPANFILKGECTDFMSVKDCTLLFNVCDPVICPTSRCDFGGKYPVQNVIQSGVIGSLVLCYPNAKWAGGDVYVPFCLSGLNAALESWISVKKAHVDCLQKSIDTGETVGICDEINSIYVCEFFWKQSLPVIKLFGQRLIDRLEANSAKGGGEYQQFSSALTNAKESFDYFTQYYAANSYRTFQIRSTENLGSEICGRFVSVVYPDEGSFLDNILKPDSPAQFTGKFEENQITTATNPPTSHYKVYYHIYAGTDYGAYYTVYLRGSGSSYYQDTAQNRLVKSSYIEKGRYADEAVDFTAPSGYRTLCIIVNGQEECGFKEVSTSFAVNYLSDLYVKDQATDKDIKTEEECRSGTASLYSILDLNVQSAAENLLNPELFAQGITRTCATENPGLGTDANANTENSRWKKVGYCGDKNIGCWIDTDSVKEAIKALNLEEKTLEELGVTSAEYLSAEYYTLNEFEEKKKEIKAETDSLKRIDIINPIFDLNKVFFNNQKAFLFFWRGKSYSELAIKTRPVCGNNVTEGTEECDDENVVDGDGCSSSCKIEEGREEQTPNDIAEPVSPKFEIRRSLLERNLCMRYFNNDWYWSLDCNNVEDSSKWISVNSLKNPYGRDPNEEDIIYIKKFQGKTFYQGLSLLIDKAVLENGLIGGNSEMSDEKVFTINIESNELNNLKFSYSEAAKSEEFRLWYWSYVDQDAFKAVTTVDDELNDIQTAALSSLEGKDFIKGAKTLFWLYFSLDYDEEDFEPYQEEEPSPEEEEIIEGDIFVIEATWFQKLGGGADLYYKYDSGWKWTPYTDNSVWMSTTTTTVTSGEYKGKSPSDKNVDIIESLNGKSYADGKKILKDNGGLMADGSEIDLSTTPSTCTNGDDKCVDTTYYICENKVWVSKGKVDGKCGYTTISEASQKILDAADKLEGVSASVVTDLDGNGRNCFDSILYIHKIAGLPFRGDCIYSDMKGKIYTHDGIEIKMGETLNSDNKVIFVVNENGCDNGGFYEEDKLNLIQPGYILDIVYNEKIAHNVIFIRWVDSNNKGQAIVFDWGAFTTGENVFEYNTINLKDNQYSVYLIRRP